MSVPETVQSKTRIARCKPCACRDPNELQPKEPFGAEFRDQVSRRCEGPALQATKSSDVSCSVSVASRLVRILLDWLLQSPLTAFRERQRRRIRWAAQETDRHEQVG